MAHNSVFLIVFLSLVHLKTTAQTPEADRLLRQLPLVKDTLKVNTLNRLSRTYWFSEPQKTIQYARQALTLSEKLAFQNGVCRAYHNLGVGYYLQNDYPSALLNFENAVAKNEQIGNRKGMGDAFNNIGLVYWKQSNYPKAVDYYLKGLKIDEERKDEKGIAMSLDNIGNVYNDQGDYPLALSYYFKALKLEKKYPDEDGFPDITLNNIGTIYLHQQRFSEALKYFFQSLKNRSEQDQEGKAVSLSNLGLAYTGLSQFPKALHYLSESLAIQQKLDDQDNMLSTLEGLATVYEKTGESKKSETYARQSLQIARRLDEKKRIASAYRLLADGAARQKDYREAYQHLTHYAQIRDSILNDENTRRIARLQATYENEKKEAAIALLREEKSRDVVVRNLIVLALLSSLVIGFLAFSRQRLRVRKNQQLHRTQQALKEAEIQNRQVREQQLEHELEFRNKALTTHTLNLIQKNGIMEEIRETIDLALKSHQPDENSPLFRRLIKLIDYSFNLDQDWDEFKMYFEGVHKDFFTKLKNRHPELSVGELRLSALIRLNMNLKEVATLLSISPDSVKTARHRLRKKLNLNEENNLTDYLITI